MKNNYYLCQDILYAVLLDNTTRLISLVTGSYENPTHQQKIPLQSLDTQLQIKVTERNA